MAQQFREPLKRADGSAFGPVATRLSYQEQPPLAALALGIWPRPGGAGPRARPAPTHHLCIPPLSAAPSRQEAFHAPVTRERVRRRGRFGGACPTGSGGAAVRACRTRLLGHARDSAAEGVCGGARARWRARLHTEQADSAGPQRAEAAPPGPYPRPAQALSTSRILGCPGAWPLLPAALPWLSCHCGVSQAAGMPVISSAQAMMAA
uniref:uncharacterized protein LOC128928663 n=1 Tax=Callithrix jacchus TaxID=9483 RepID=UPI0023DD153B|nr:uncharacterized protein LOC128928663 [Callithrix jacchus]